MIRGVSNVVSLKEWRGERSGAGARLLGAVHRHGLRRRTIADDLNFVGLTQGEAARLAGLSRLTANEYAQKMRKKAILRDDNKTLAVLPGTGFALGVDFSRSHHTRVALSDVHGVLIDVLPGKLDQRLNPQSRSEALDFAANSIVRIMKRRNLTANSIIGVGVGLPGPVNGNIAIGPDAGPWGPPVGAADELARRLGWKLDKFTTGNDAYLSALSESLWGGGQVSDHTVYVKWSAHVRAALIIDGQLYVGHSKMAGELPHVLVEGDRSSLVCEQCDGAGCVHKIAALKTIASIAGDERMRAAAVVSRACEDETTKAALKLAATGIGRAIAPYVAALNPEHVVLGGALGSRAFPLVLDELTEEISEKHTSNALEVKVLGARVNENTSLKGAIALALMSRGQDYLWDQYNAA